MGNVSKYEEHRGKRHVRHSHCDTQTYHEVSHFNVQSPSHGRGKRITPVTPLSSPEISPVSQKVPLLSLPLSPPSTSLDISSPSQSPTYKCHRCLRIFRNETNVNAHFWCRKVPHSKN